MSDGLVHEDSEEMVDMLTLSDALQALGVSAVDANRYVASVVRKDPSLMEIWWSRE